DKLQRYIHREFILVTNVRLRIIIESDFSKYKKLICKRIKYNVWHTLNSLLGHNPLRLVLSADDAMSLLGIARNWPKITVKF
ncbi:MAG: hypothetical protein ABIJ45_02260, partial [Candidatus Zixiibacteriota bacterium]